MTSGTLSKEMFLFNKNHSKFNRSSYSQCGEDLIIQFVFGLRNISNPTYLDIGAHHPWKINNTAKFYINGSHGVNIEPDPELYKLLNKERKLDINLNIGISDSDGDLDFYVMFPKTMSTFDKDAADYLVKEYNFKITSVLKIKVETVNDVITQYFNGHCPDLLSIDTEGLDLRILQSINYKMYKPKIICVETISYSESGRGEKNYDIHEILYEKGYMLYADTNVNSIFVLDEFWKIVK